jgi:hypothetical protein
MTISIKRAWNCLIEQLERVMFYRLLDPLEITNHSHCHSQRNSLSLKIKESFLPICGVFTNNIDAILIRNP